MKKAMTLVAVALALVAGALAGVWLLTRGTPAAPTTTAPPSDAPSAAARSVPEAAVPEEPSPMATVDKPAPDRRALSVDAAPHEPAAPRRTDLATPKLEEHVDAAPAIGSRTELPPAPTPPAVKVDSELAPPSPRRPEAPSSPEPPAATTAGALASGSQGELASIQRVLERYQDVYDQLDANLAAPIWPRMDRRALAKVFARLKQQKLSFDDCAVALDEARATAQCTGWLTYVPQVGSDTPRREHHSWTIEFERTGGEWLILRVAAR